MNNESNEIVRREYASLMPQSFNQKMAMAQILLESRFLPDHLNTAAKIAVALQWGHELGLEPMASTNNIYIVNGKPSLSTDIMHALVMRSAEYSGSKWLTKSNDTQKAEVVIKRKLKNGSIEEFSGYFDMEMAKNANLLHKDNWKKHPDRMLRKRALSFALRDGYPDILAGVYDPDELEVVSINNSNNKNNLEPTDVTDSAIEYSTLKAPPKNDILSLFDEAFQNGEITQAHYDVAKDPNNKKTLNERLLQNMKNKKKAFDVWVKAHSLEYITKEQLDIAEKKTTNEIGVAILEQIITTNGFNIEDFEAGIKAVVEDENDEKIDEIFDKPIGSVENSLVDTNIPTYESLKNEKENDGKTEDDEVDNDGQEEFEF